MTVDPDKLPVQQEGEHQLSGHRETLRRSFAELLAWFGKRAPDEKTAQDLAQETWKRFRAWQKDDPGKMPDNLTAFLINQAEWVRRTYFKKSYKINEYELLRGDIADLAVLADARLLTSAPLPALLERFITTVDLGRALASLHDKKRRALMLRFIDDMDTCEIAGVLGVSARRVNQMIDEAITALRESRLLDGYRTDEGGHR